MFFDAENGYRFYCRRHGWQVSDSGSQCEYCESEFEEAEAIGVEIDFDDDDAGEYQNDGEDRER